MSDVSAAVASLCSFQAGVLRPNLGAILLDLVEELSKIGHLSVNRNEISTQNTISRSTLPRLIDLAMLHALTVVACPAMIDEYLPFIVKDRKLHLRSCVLFIHARDGATYSLELTFRGPSCV